MDDGDRTSSSSAIAAEPDPEPEPAARLGADLVDDDGDWSAFAPADAVVMAAVRLVSEAPELAFEPSEATVVLSSDAHVRELNRTYRQQDKPTNVLSFPAPRLPSDIEAGRALLGDIVLAAETIVREAEALAVSPAHHLQHLVVHGLLHLLGYDHQTDQEAAEMEALETRLLSRLGIADPYAEPAS